MMDFETLRWVLLMLVALVLLFAWIDGGREPQRLIVQEVELPGVPAEAGGGGENARGLGSPAGTAR